MVPFKCLQNLAFAETARKNLMSARLLLLAKFSPVTRVTWRKTFPFIKKTSGKRKIYIPFAVHSACILSNHHKDHSITIS